MMRVPLTGARISGQRIAERIKSKCHKSKLKSFFFTSINIMQNPGFGGSVLHVSRLESAIYVKCLRFSRLLLLSWDIIIESKKLKNTVAI